MREQNLNYDEITSTLIGSGVLVIDHSTAPGVGTADAHFVERDGAGVAHFLQPGDPKLDLPDGGHSVEVLQGFADGSFEVRVTNGLDPDLGDLDITPWGTNASPDGWRYESPDIWIDSTCQTRPGVFRWTDSSGQPIGNGDRLCITEPDGPTYENEVCVRMRNLGTKTLTPEITLEYTDRTVSNQGWRSVQAVPPSLVNPEVIKDYPLNPLPAGATRTDCFSEWIVRSDDVPDHACFRVTLRAAGAERELHGGNNLAEENFWTEESSQNSPWSTASVVVRLANTFDIPKTMGVALEQIPDGWSYRLSDGLMELQPGRRSIQRWLGSFLLAVGLAACGSDGTGGGSADPEGTLGRPCSDPDDCSDGESCNFGPAPCVTTCQLACESGSECPAAFPVCSDTCQAPCIGDDDCGAGRRCEVLCPVIAPDERFCVEDG